MFTQSKQALLYALAFLTRLPLGRWLKNPDENTRRRAVYCYPLVGVVIGVILVVVAGLLMPLGVFLSAAILLAIWVALTGALHLDGLADCMDAYYAGHKYAAGDQRRQRVLAVMHDSTCGAVAIVAVVVLLIAKFAALVQWQANGLPLWGLLWAPLLARTVILPFMTLSPYARAQGLLPALNAQEVQRLWLIALGVLACVLLSVGLVAACVLVVTLAGLMLFWSRLWRQQVGGYTGDCLGALVELSELLVLIVWVALWS